jgi:hypothetical protein
MTRPACPHCNGTTFCGGFRRKDTLVTQPACTTCLVKSGLPPKEVHHRVVCAVCGGTGLLTIRKRSSGAAVLIASPFLLAAGALFTLSVIGLHHYLTRDEEIKQGVERTLNTAPLRVSAQELREKVSIGMTPDELRSAIGNPNMVKQLDNGGSILEVWYYHCRDGRMQVSLQDDRVTSIH